MNVGIKLRVSLRSDLIAPWQGLESWVQLGKLSVLNDQKLESAAHLSSACERHVFSRPRLMISCPSML